MFAKLLLIISITGATACILLVNRQQRIETANEIAHIHRCLLEHDQALWTMRNDVAARCQPDEVRLAIEERASISPDALTGMEASLRFPGAENCDSKIFGRLSAWQNWIFQRPNAVGPTGALTLYGKPERPVFDRRRT